MSTDLRCPHCGEPIDAWVDPGGGAEQDYIEDCAVCCRPIRFVAVYDPDRDDYRIAVSGDV